MSKYYLVANYYDKNTSSYSNEVILNPPGVDLSTLSKIDAFTSKYGSYEILKLMEKIFNNVNINHLAIKYYEYDTPKYLKIIEKNLDFHKLALTTYRDSKNKSNMVSINSLYFKKEFNDLMSILSQEDMNIASFLEHYDKDDKLLSLVNKYLYFSFDNEEDLINKKNLLTQIKQEFSKYNVFRRWIILKNKRNLRKVYNTNVKKNSTNANANSNKTTTTPSYSNLVEEHNLKYLDQDKEEFLEESEMGIMYEYSDSSFDDDEVMLRRHRRR